MVGLTNKQLEDLGKKLLGKSFLGVYPSDSIPEIKNTHCSSIIFNLSKHTEPGSHYVAVLFKKNQIFYFDSYGKPLRNYNIKKNLIKFKLPMYYHDRSIQDNDSIFCGFYALAYLKAIQHNNMKPIKFFIMFNSPPNKENDNIVTKFLLSK
jgi:hypothetical protein